jgi:hypothetical protein
LQFHSNATFKAWKNSEKACIDRAPDETPF